MIKLVSAALLAAPILVGTLPAAAVAGEVPTRTFTRDGETYVYNSVPKGDKTLLTGRAYPSGRNFSLTVRGNRVRGYSGGVPVSFVADRGLYAGGTEIAAR